VRSGRRFQRPELAGVAHLVRVPGDISDRGTAAAIASAVGTGRQRRRGTRVVEEAGGAVEQRGGARAIKDLNDAAIETVCRVSTMDMGNVP
jgi:hypothetical protein